MLRKKKLVLIMAMIAGTLILLSLFLSYQSSIKGRVIDAETGKPIEGAVVLVEWTKTKGFGLTYTESYKAAEAVSDKEGKFTLPGCYSPFVNEPNVTIYKKGYVAWSSRWIFPDYRNMENITWKNEYVVKMQRFSENESHDKHEDFIMSSINSSLNIESKKILFDAFEWERELALQERLRGKANVKK